MNILFVGPYKQLDEWGRKSRALLGALKRTGNLVTSRPIYFAPPSWGYSEEAEYSSAPEYDICIQFTLPAFAVYNGSFKKNIGVFNIDTIDTSSSSTPISRMGLLDEVWVESPRIHKSLSGSAGLSSKISLVKPYLDISLEGEAATGRFPEGILRSGPFKDKFIFYAIGSMSEQEGAAELLAAYFSEFSASDNCALVYILEEHRDAQEVNNLVETCHRRTGAIKPPSEKPLLHIMNPDGPLPVDARLLLHKEGDCFVHPNYSLNCSCLILEGISAQSTPIVNKNTAAYDLWGESSLWGVESYEEKCLLNQRSFDDVFTSNETWVRPTVKSLSEQMREAYTNKFARESKQSKNESVKEDFQSDEYYQSLKELLCF